MGIAAVAGQFDKEASQNARLLRGKNRDASHGSPRSFAAQRRLAQDDNQTVPRLHPLTGGPASL
jgi:hypothetical protein